jgi:hypothetical protein
LQGEEWFPVKIDTVPKAAVFKANNSIRHNFIELFRMGYDGADTKRVIWLNGTKPYGVNGGLPIERERRPMRRAIPDSGIYL